MCNACLITFRCRRVDFRPRFSVHRHQKQPGRSYHRCFAVFSGNFQIHGSKTPCTILSLPAKHIPNNKLLPCLQADRFPRPFALPMMHHAIKRKHDFGGLLIKPQSPLMTVFQIVHIPLTCTDNQLARCYLAVYNIACILAGGGEVIHLQH